MKTIPEILSTHENRRDILIAFAQVCATRAARNARAAKRTTNEKDYASVNDLATRAAQAAACVQDAPTDVLAIHHASEAARYAVEVVRAYYTLHLGKRCGEIVARDEHTRQIEELCEFLRKKIGGAPCP
jgi:hypothetical protein